MRARFTGGSDAGCAGCAASGAGIAIASTSAASTGRRMGLLDARPAPTATPSCCRRRTGGEFRGAGLQPCVSARRVDLAQLPDDAGDFVARVVDLRPGRSAAQAEPERRARAVGVEAE